MIDDDEMCHWFRGVGIYAFGGTHVEPFVVLWADREDGDELQDQPTVIVWLAE